MGVRKDLAQMRWGHSGLWSCVSRSGPRGGEKWGRKPVVLCHPALPERELSASGCRWLSAGQRLAAELLLQRPQVPKALVRGGGEARKMPPSRAFRTEEMLNPRHRMLPPPQWSSPR